MTLSRFFKTHLPNLASTNAHSLPQVEIADLVFVVQDSVNGPDGTRAFLRPVFFRIANYLFHCFQMMLDSRSVFRRPIIKIFQPPARCFLLLPWPPSLPP